MDEQGFKRAIWRHYRAHGRRMPWRETRDPYRILVSEVMLQQTQVARAAKFYPRFLRRFPNFRALARARTSSVLDVWQGLGYNRRALALQRLSRIVLEKFHGRLPRERAVLESLPGIGPATAGSLRAFIWNEPEVFIETNIRRAYIHFFFEGRRKVTDASLERYIRRTVSRKNPREWYWALMDYGAALGAGNPTHSANPNRKSAHYRSQARFRGSDRELRGKIIKALLQSRNQRNGIALLELRSRVDAGGEGNRFAKVVERLSREGFCEERGKRIMLAR